MIRGDTDRTFSLTSYINVPGAIFFATAVKVALCGLVERENVRKFFSFAIKLPSRAVEGYLVAELTRVCVDIGFVHELVVNSEQNRVVHRSSSGSRGIASRQR